MESTLNDGDRVFVSRAVGFVSGYRHGDLVMTRVHDNIGSRYIIKRVVAIPSDTLLIENGQVIVNGDVVPFDSSANAVANVSGNLSLTLSPGYYFLMGDNHIFSTDSRDFGPLHVRDIHGRVLFRFFGGNFNIY